MYATPFNRHQAENFIRKVDDQFHQQRRQMLALDTPLTILLPQHLQGLPTSATANYIADRLLFTLAACTGQTVCLSRARLWLEGCIDYLFHRCNPIERTFYYLIMLTQLPRPTRNGVFENYFSAGHPLRYDREMPEVLRELEVVAVLLLFSAGKLRKMASI